MQINFKYLSLISRLLFWTPCMYMHEREANESVEKRAQRRQEAEEKRKGEVWKSACSNWPRVSSSLSASCDACSLPLARANVVRNVVVRLLSLFVTHRSILSFSLAPSFLIHSATPFPFPFFHAVHDTTHTFTSHSSATLTGRNIALLTDRQFLELSLLHDWSNMLLVKFY